MTDQAPDVDAGRTRQARWGRHALIILVVSLALVVVGFAVIHGVFSGPLSGKSGNAAAPPQVASQVNAPPPQARWSDAGGVTGHSPPPTQSEPSASNPS
jgi:hypothetical protein